MVTVLTMACATVTDFDRLFEARQYQAAARAFGDDPSLLDRDRALFRAALVYGLPESPVFDPTVARTLLERLLDRHPGSTHSDEARRLLALLRGIEAERAAAAEQRRALDRRIENLTRETESLRRRLDWLSVRFQLQEGQTQLLQLLADMLEADLEAKKQRIRALQEELERLKAIDLNPPLSRPDTTPAARW
jgi:hypothetical protein